LGIKLYGRPKLKNPDMIASWTGIGNIGLLAVDTLRGQTRAKELGEVEPWDFFYPRRVRIKASLLKALEFPTSKFYYQKLEGKDLIFFIGEEQPTTGGKMYAEGEKAYQMANLVLDAAERFGCRRVYSSGAAVALTHHDLKPRVWAVTSHADLSREMKRYKNVSLMGEIEGKGNQGSITGLNGLLLGAAKQRGFEAICLMGEIPDYLSRAPYPYPRASKSVLEVLSSILRIEVNLSVLDSTIAQVDDIIDKIYEKFPPEIRERIDQRKSDAQTSPEIITDEDERWIKDHIDEFFQPGGERGK